METGSVVTVGTFDGVHLGHRAVLAEVDRLARKQGRERVAYVFEFPPRATLGTDPFAGLILPIDLREDLLRGFVDRVVLARFAEVRNLSPGTFVEEVLVQRLGTRTVVVGEGFRFGSGRGGDVAMLRTLGREHGFDVRSAAPAMADGDPVSSTRIRRLLIEGRIGEAAALLGRPPILVGYVTEGEKIERDLGYPTANLSVGPQILFPADGIYFAHVFVNGGRDHGLLYVDSRPTIAESDRRCKVHLLSPPEGELYQTRMEVHVLDRLRDDRAFSTLDALGDQIARDIDAARELIEHHPFSGGPIGG
ncbi:riboflavin biosynthesis protein RibF [Candidatus Bipolaricaulota bacterium]